MISKCLKNEQLPVYGNGLNVRDWLYVKDHCRAIDLIIHEGRVGEIYNVGGNYLPRSRGWWSKMRNVAHLPAEGGRNVQNVPGTF